MDDATNKLVGEIINAARNNSVNVKSIYRSKRFINVVIPHYERGTKDERNADAFLDDLRVVERKLGLEQEMEPCSEYSYLTGERLY